MTIQRLSSADAFVLIDLPDAERSDGLVRCARKVLVDSTRALARVRTYAWALLEQRIGGASGGINSEGEDRPGAITAFSTELAPRVASGELSLGAGKGVDAAQLDALGTVVQPDVPALVAGLLACAAALTGGLEGARVAVEYDGGTGSALRTAIEAAGASVEAEGPDALGVTADILMFGSKPALIDHDRAANLRARHLVPTGELAFTPRALAVASRGGAVVLPDFLTTAGPLAARAGLDPATTLAALTDEVLAHPEGAVLGACRRAEQFLSGWVSELPFGRPIG